MSQPDLSCTAAVGMNAALHSQLAADPLRDMQCMRRGLEQHGLLSSVEP